MMKWFGVGVLFLFLCQFASAGTRQSVSAHDRKWLPRYRVERISTLGGRTANALGVNPIGDVVGSASNAQGIRHAFIRFATTGAVIDLDPGNPSRASEAWSLNRFNDVAGYRHDSNSDYRATVWLNAQSYIDLGAPGGTESYAHDINDNLLTVGTLYTLSSNRSGFYWTPNGGFRILPEYGVNNSVAWAVNENGTIVGESFVPPPAPNSAQAAVWQFDSITQTVTSLPILLGAFAGGNNSTARAINEKGSVVGVAQSLEFASVGFFLNAAGISSPDPSQHLVPIWPLAHGRYSAVFAINDRNEVVGASGTSNLFVDHAIYWHPRTGLIDLNRTIVNDPEKEWILVSANRINNRGVIVGYGLYRGEAFHAFRLVPDANND